MKMTVEISEDLFARAREVAQREGTTLRNLIEEGLRVTLAQREQKNSYRWPDLSVPGEGLAQEMGEGSWESVRERIYSGRGSIPGAEDEESSHPLRRAPARINSRR